jgi:hypothetical protein
LSKLAIRPARPYEIPFLQAKANQQLPANYQPVDLERSVVYTAEDTDGLLAGVAAAHLGWQIEPLLLFPEFTRSAVAHSQRMATYRLARAIVDHLEDPAKNEGRPGFFAHVGNPDFRDLAVNFGLHQAYEAGVILKGGFR